MNSDLKYNKVFVRSSINYEDYIELVFTSEGTCLFFDGFEFTHKDIFDFEDSTEITELYSERGFRILKTEQNGLDDFTLLLDSGIELKIISTINFDDSITQKIIW